MDQNPASRPEDEKKRPVKELLVWLALIPLILGTLLCCGQMALFYAAREQGHYTSSLLAADYRPWSYDQAEQIRPVDVEGFMSDVQKEQAFAGATVIPGVFWSMPTATAVVVAIGTVPPDTRVTGTSTARPTAPTTRPTTPPTVTRTPVPPTSPPTTTATRPATKTSTHIIILPSFTPTPRHPTVTRPPATHTPTSTPTLMPAVPPTETTTPPATPPPPPPPPPTWTPTPSPTNPGTIITPITPTPTYAPVRPIAENNGQSDPVNFGGCRAYFGYDNNNPDEVDIAYGLQNILDDPAVQAAHPQPSHFLVGRVFGAFEVTWYSGRDLTWLLDGRTATANWCY